MPALTTITHPEAPVPDINFLSAGKEGLSLEPVLSHELRQFISLLVINAGGEVRLPESSLNLLTYANVEIYHDVRTKEVVFKSRPSPLEITL
jgi:hypothetical protein